MATKPKFFLLLFLFPFFGWSQNDYQKIRLKSGEIKERQCKKYHKLTDKIPEDIRFYVDIENRNIVLTYPSDSLFKKIFNHGKDGIGIELVHRSQIDCINEPVTDENGFYGQLLPPVFKKELKRRKHTDEYGNLSVVVGELPEGYDATNSECNLLIIQRKNLCDYRRFSFLAYTNWDFLDMPLYADSIPEGVKPNLQLQEMATFEILFGLNETTIAPEDLKHLIDSIRQSQFYVKAIEVIGYASVEGTTQVNEELQQARANNLAKALQQEQDSTIQLRVKSFENWQQFAADVKGTPFEYLLKLDKAQVKQELINRKNDLQLQALLEKQRKVTAKFYLQKDITVEDNPQEAVALFNTQVKKNQLQTALYIQHKIFEQIRANQFPEEFYKQLEIPQNISCGSLLNHQALFSYQQEDQSLTEQLEAFKQLDSLLPNNAKIRYNLTVLNLRTTTAYNFDEKEDELYKQIRTLDSRIDKNLTSRLKVNFYLAGTEYYNRTKDYKKKNRFINNVYSEYRSANLTDEELVSTARFLANYSQFNKAIQTLEKRAYSPEANASLVDYFIRLTLTDPKYYRSTKYQQLLLRFSEKQPNLFCPIFLPRGLGGVSFKLLFTPELAKVYCSNCQ